jgi:hypothetical protein
VAGAEAIFAPVRNVPPRLPVLFAFIDILVWESVEDRLGGVGAAGT